MADSVFEKDYVKCAFWIPEWYVMSKREEDKLRKYIRDTRSQDEARMFRIMDCSAFCDERFCYFCASYEKDIQPLCTPCNGCPVRE